MRPFGETLSTWLGRQEPGELEAREAFDAILHGEWTTAQVAAFAVAIRARGETPAVIVAAARALRAAMVPVTHTLARVIDTCGTGGDGHHTLNISTAAAIVVAAAGEHVAKHGNRSISSRCGSADVIEALGIAIDPAAEVKRRSLESARIAFMFAPSHHPALKHAAQARRELGIRTLFNALGPLVNPAEATHQLVGVYEDRLRPIVAAALGELGSTRAWVVRGEDGLDEVSPSASTFVSEWLAGEVRDFRITPEDFGIDRLPADAIRGGSAEENAQAIERIVGGDACHPAFDAVILNAAACLVVARGISPREAASVARASILDGDAIRTLGAWRAISGRAG